MFSTEFNIVYRIEKILKNSNEEDLKELKFNYDYTIANLKIFSGELIPKICQKDVDGVFNVEYDVDFSNIKNNSINNFMSWVTNE